MTINDTELNHHQDHTPGEIAGPYWPLMPSCLMIRAQRAVTVPHTGEFES